MKNLNSVENKLVKIPLDTSIKKLIEVISDEIVHGQERIELERRQTYWNVGKHIKSHLYLNAKRENYGEYLIPALVEHLNIDRATLYRCV